jgi:hypothetical protein
MRSSHVAIQFPRFRFRVKAQAADSGFDGLSGDAYRRSSVLHSGGR